MSKFIDINVNKSKDAVKIAIAGEIDLSTIDHIKPVLEDLKMENKDIIVDMDEVKFIDSTGLGVFVKMYKDQKSIDKIITVINTRDSVRKIFKITCMEEMFNMGVD